MGEIIFPETHEKCVQKMLGKKSQKSEKNVYLHSHEYGDKKLGGNKCGK